MESSIAMQDATHRRRTLLVELEFLLSSTEESGDEPGRTRACNPRLCRPMPYPLGHGASCFAAAGRARMARDSAAKLGNGSMTVRTCVRACMRACAHARALARLHAHGGRTAAWTALLHRARF